MSVKKSNVIKQLISFIDKDSIIVFAGKPICSESIKFDNLNVICIDDDCGYGLSMLLGIAMGTTKKVYLFCEDYYLLKDLSSLVHLGISKLRNLFIFCIITGHYPHLNNMPTIVRSIPSIKTLVFEIGFLINDYTSHFKAQIPIKQLKSVITTISGPLLTFIGVDNIKETKPIIEDLTFNFEEQIIKLRTSLQKESTALFKTPLVVVDKEEIIKNGL